MKFIKNISLFCLLGFVASTSFGMEKKELVEISEEKKNKSKIDLLKTPFWLQDENILENSKSYREAIDNGVRKVLQDDIIWIVCSFFSLKDLYDLREVSRDTKKLIEAYFKGGGSKYPIYAKLKPDFLFHGWLSSFFKEFLDMNRHPLRVSFTVSAEKPSDLSNCMNKINTFPRLCDGIYRLIILGSVSSEVKAFLPLDEMNFKNLKFLSLNSCTIDIKNGLFKKCLNWDKCEKIEVDSCNIFQLSGMAIDLENLKVFASWGTSRGLDNLASVIAKGSLKNLEQFKGQNFVSFILGLKGNSKLTKICDFGSVKSIPHEEMDEVKGVFRNIHELKVQNKIGLLQPYQGDSSKVGCLPYCINLVKLTVLCDGLRDNTLKGLSHLEKLREVYILVKGFTDKGLKFLPISIEILDISGNQVVTGEGLSHLKNLKKLNASGCRKISDDTLKFLPDSIQELKIQNIGSFFGNGLRHLRKLKELDVSENPSFDASSFMLIVACLPSLEKICGNFKGRTGKHRLNENILCTNSQDGIYKITRNTDGERKKDNYGYSEMGNESSKKTKEPLSKLEKALEERHEELKEKRELEKKYRLPDGTIDYEKRKEDRFLEEILGNPILLEKLED